jgi:hypothetical protein
MIKDIFYYIIRLGANIEISDAEFFVANKFIVHKYPFENIKCVARDVSPYFGQILIIGFIKKDKKLKVKKLLNIKAHKSEDIKKLIKVLHIKCPNIQLPKQ